MTEARRLDVAALRTRISRRATLRRRYKVVAAGLLAVLMSILGVGFAADAGTTTVSVTAPAGVAVYTIPASAGGTAPTGAVDLPHGSQSVLNSATWGTPVSPAWNVSAGSAGTLSTSNDGDVVYIDATGATSTKLQVSVYVINLAELAVNYTSWAWNVGLYNGATATGMGTAGSPAQEQVITSDSGQLNFVVDVTTNKHVSISLEAGGSFYTIQTDTTNGDLSPTFFVRVQQL